MGRWLLALYPLRQVVSHDPRELGPAAREARHEHDTTCHLKNKLCGSRLKPRHHSAKKNWASAPRAGWALRRVGFIDINLSLPSASQADWGSVGANGARPRRESVSGETFRRGRAGMR